MGYFEQIGSVRFVLAYYGFRATPKNMGQVYQMIVSWFDELGFPPDRLGVGRKGHRDGKLGTFSRTNAILERSGFDDVVHFDLHSSLPNAKVSGAQFYAAGCFDHSDGGYCVVSIPHEVASKDQWLPTSREIIESLGPSYGIGYERDLRNGPVFYALGVNVGTGIGQTPAERDEGRRISRWSDLAMVQQVYRDGLIRDVYPWSFLTQPQLNRPVGKVTLEKWIEQDAERGQLSSMPKGVVMWEVEESRVPAIRSALQEANVIFDWRKFIKSDSRSSSATKE